MAKVNATDVTILISNVEIGNLTNCELEVNREMFDVTTKDSGTWKEILPGLTDWKMNGELTLDYSATYAADDIFTALTAGTSLSVKFGLPGSGNQKYSGTGYYSQYGQSAGVQDKVTVKFNIEGTAALSQITTT